MEEECVLPQEMFMFVKNPEHKIIHTYDLRYALKRPLHDNLRYTHDGDGSGGGTLKFTSAHWIVVGLQTFLFSSAFFLFIL